MSLARKPDRWWLYVLLFVRIQSHSHSLSIFPTMIFARSFIVHHTHTHSYFLLACLRVPVPSRVSLSPHREDEKRRKREKITSAHPFRCGVCSEVRGEREEDEIVSPQAYDNFCRIIKAHTLFGPFQLTYARAWSVFVVVVNVFSFLLFSFSHLLSFGIDVTAALLLFLSLPSMSFWPIVVFAEAVGKYLVRQTSETERMYSEHIQQRIQLITCLFCLSHFHSIFCSLRPCSGWRRCLRCTSRPRVVLCVCLRRICVYASLHLL